MRDVAALAGVSLKTVSRVVNDEPGVSGAVRERVREAADRLDYRPNLAASFLRSADGRTGRLDNFQRVTVWGAKGKSGHRVLSGQDKGQKSEVERFVEAVLSGAPMPIGLDSLAATTWATLAIERSLATGKTERSLATPGMPVSV